MAILGDVWRAYTCRPSPAAIHDHWISRLPWLAIAAIAAGVARHHLVFDHSIALAAAAPFVIPAIAIAFAKNGALPYIALYWMVTATADSAVTAIAIVTGATSESGFFLMDTWEIAALVFGAMAIKQAKQHA